MAREFDGSTDKRITYTLSANGRSALDSGGSIMAWIRPDSDGGGNEGRYLDSADSGSTGWFCAVDDESGGNVKIFLEVRNSSTNGKWNTSTAVVPINSYSNCITTYDDSSTANDPSFYLDGSSQTVNEIQAPSATPNNASGNIVIGNNYSSSVREFDGDIFCGCIWNTVLSSAEIQALANGVNPFVIRNSNLVWFSPLWGNEDPEPEYITPANAGVLTNSPPKSTNPPMQLLSRYL